ncbi:Uncharacterised protein [Legionella lansingensis]|uniref:Transmembrane protein n=1 Tax=Legionella lansingensis TaxID=45067 RepID=A0A0W0VJK5_9GAMM|nr:hypothetical protein [Legionella lansingensis]KTD20276.1 hypothetical protein Llan_1927 [Legionella lansingensis]SNV50290.1 Uncharacterised protein [Legionella lansingensis]
MSIKKNIRKDELFLIAGIIGSFILLVGVTHTPAQKYYVLGSALLLLTSIHFKLIYFIALEMIMMAGHSAILLGIGTALQIALPILLCVQLLTFYFLSGQLNNVLLLIGITGIAVLSVGFSYENQWVFFSGSLFIAIYAFYTAYRGKPVTLLWAILNSLFAFIALLKLIFT